MRRTPLCLALAAALAWPAAVGAKTAKPDWVDGKSSQYPTADYLLGVGMADERSTAEDRARNEIAKVFVVRVQSTTSDATAESSKTGGKKKEDYTFSQEVGQKIQTVTDKTLQDVAVQEIWQDEATRRYYALAVLKRSKAARGLTEQISDFDAKASSWAKELESGTDKLGKVKAAMKLQSLMKARADLNQDLRIVDPSGSGVPAPYDEAALGPKAAKALADLEIVVNIQE